MRSSPDRGARRARSSADGIRVTGNVGFVWARRVRVRGEPDSPRSTGAPGMRGPARRARGPCASTGSDAAAAAERVAHPVGVRRARDRVHAGVHRLIRLRARADDPLHRILAGMLEIACARVLAGGGPGVDARGDRLVGVYLSSASEAYAVAAPIARRLATSAGGIEMRLVMIISRGTDGVAGLRWGHREGLWRGAHGGRGRERAGSGPGAARW